ncbi:ATP-binding cassette domain-containing protein [Peptoniphilus genitalis]
MLYYKNKDEREKEIEKIIKDFTLESMLRKKANELSLGMLQKLKLALSFITNSNIVILDEPFNGLDIESTVILKEKIKESKKLGKTIIITSHNTEQ